MKLKEFLLILFLTILIFLSECPAGIAATRLCPVRAEPVYPAEVNGVVRCTCVHPYFGKNCRLKVEQNSTILLNVSRMTKDSIMITWFEKKENIKQRRYVISVRNVNYRLGSTGYSKWRKATITYTNMNSDQSTSLPSSKLSKDSVPKSRKEIIYMVRLPAKSSYEVKVTILSTIGDYVGSTSVFLDKLDASASGKMLSVSDTMEKIKHYLISSFEDECELKGVGTGVVIGSLSSLVLMAFVYVLTRYCCKCKRKRKPGLNDKSETEDDPLEDVSTENEKENENENRSSSYVVIEIEDIEFAAVETPTTTERAESTASPNVLETCLFTKNVPKAPTREKSFKSVILDIPETKIDEEEPTQEPVKTESNTKVVEPTTKDAYGQ